MTDEEMRIQVQHWRENPADFVMEMLNVKSPYQKKVLEQYFNYERLKKQIAKIDEAINHCYEVSERCTKFHKYTCSLEHLQLALWLEDYKRLLKKEISIGE